MIIFMSTRPVYLSSFMIGRLLQIVKLPQRSLSASMEQSKVVDTPFLNTVWVSCVQTRY
ncbi:uncharacterized protein C8R40DRAFT_1129570, partial [Lentinula edodes]|uniref:uncharacterized protein n=1 Tax=Lentinula edodes TaxID=5353 RepID=UPI001E8D0DEC